MKFELEIVKFNVADVITASTEQPSCPSGVGDDPIEW